MGRWKKIKGGFELIESEKDKVKDKVAENTYQAIAYELSSLVKTYGIDEVVAVINQEFGELIMERRKSR